MTQQHLHCPVRTTCARAEGVRPVRAAELQVAEMPQVARPASQGACVSRAMGGHRPSSPIHGLVRSFVGGNPNSASLKSVGKGAGVAWSFDAEGVEGLDRGYRFRLLLEVGAA